MHDFEKLGLFYLGRHYDWSSDAVLPELVLYDSRDLLTHAVCVGMTGSGKTGLCIGLIEEAAIDGVPVIAIDPKGDLGNLLLTFPQLRPEDFRPWIDDDEARRAGQTPEQFAAAQAHLWTDGLAAWGQDGGRVERLRSAAEFTIFTPGSRAGIPVSILESFAAPARAIREEAELLTERATTAATSVLALAGLDAQPRSREHTLLVALLIASWRAGRNLDLAGLIRQIQSPPFQNVGVLDLESYYPSRDRFGLAVQLNALLAAPGFEQWLTGAPLDPATLLYTPAGQPRVAIFSIAHLNDAERMFFVSLLLNQIVAWMRTQTGTTSLRAMLYMDEIFGYFPPVANPPSKAPLLTLLKQGRGFGLGVVLASQNPVDLDYKGLANAGTWLLGRLQTERDKARVLDGIEGASTGSLPRAEADRLLSGLGKRVFLLHNVHNEAPVVFQTRWTLSYLRGPLSRDQIRRLTAERDAGEAGNWTSSGELDRAGIADLTRAGRTNVDVKARVETEGMGDAADTHRSVPEGTAPPIVPPGIQQFFVPRTPRSRGQRIEESADSPSLPQQSRVTYFPVVLGAARIAFSEARLAVDDVRDVLYAAPVSEGAIAVDWANARALEISAADLQREAEQPAAFASVPDAALRAANYAAWQKSFVAWLMQSERAELLRHAESKLTSHPGESERDFRIRLRDAQRAARDRAIDAVRKKYAAKQAQLADRLRRAEAAVVTESKQASQATLQTAVSMGSTLLAALLGRKAVSTATLGRATTAARGVGRTMKERGDIQRAGENVAAVREQIRALEAQIESEVQEIVAQIEEDAPLQPLVLTPKRGQITAQFVALGWIPGS